MSRAAPTWWPPKIGDKLRHGTKHHGGGGRMIDVEVLLHVLSVFEDKDGEQRIVTSEWFPTERRWNYTVMWWYEAAIGLIWRDGTKKPEEP